MDSMREDHLVLHDGQVMIVRNGEMTPLEQEMTLPDGMKVSPDGTVMTPDGTTRRVQAGETILLQGMPAGPEQMSDRQFQENMEDEELRDDIQ